MKNKLLLSLVLVFLMASPNLSFAQSENSSNGKGREVQTIKDRIDAEKEAIRLEVASKTDFIKNSVEETRQNAINKIIDRVNQFVQNIITRYEAAVNRLNTLANRIDSRIKKMEAKNIDVTKAKELLAVAKTKIEIARTSSGDIASTTDNTIFGTTTAAVKGNFQAIKAQIEKAKEDIKAVHAALVDVVNNLKPGDNKFKNSTSTDSTGTSTDNNN